LKVTDADTCKRFYRDQCLHGLAVADPGVPAVDKCINALQVAGGCTKGGANICGVALAPTKTVKNTCDVIEHPEVLADCAFLSTGTTTSTDPTLADGGTAGSAGASGAAGTSGSAGAEAAGAAGSGGTSEGAAGASAGSGGASAGAAGASAGAAGASAGSGGAAGASQ
jgi:hypothetical protein